ncbi:cell division inhibitor SulA [Shewanella youngdeokensis]|uniref:SulA-like leucine-rich domain-containing protein n=1 Tax=Shewanella youngdeokensis TaxID=2999068 RepID=A0ABZ0JZ35_9GAMM|nr:SulA-like leucine-rich domain-containing protein [Shewanella sp. DAU334]
MNKFLGVAPRHPGLWQDAPNQAMSKKTNTDIITMVSHTQGRNELKAICAQLARLSQQGRWIVLVSPPNIGYKNMLAAAGVRMDRILLVHAKDEVETLWAMEKALTSGTSSAVITWTNELDTRDNRRLQLVAKSAQAEGIIIENANSHLPDSSINTHDNVYGQGSLFTAMH